jgi:hypothetical protein
VGLSKILIKKLPKVSNRPMAENLPDLATLIRTRCLEAEVVQLQSVTVNKFCTLVGKAAKTLPLVQKLHTLVQILQTYVQKSYLGT